MNFKFEFNHHLKHFDDAFPNNINPKDVFEILDKIQAKSKDLNKTEVMEMLLTDHNPQTPNDIFVLGLAFGSATSLERLVNMSRDSLVPPAVSQAVLEGLMRAAYGNAVEECYEKVELNKEEFNKHIKEKKDDF
jgi:hypothetical protein